MKRLVVHIDRLVLRGLHIADLRSFEAGLEAGLAHSLGEIPIERLPHRDPLMRHEPAQVRIPQGAGAGAIGQGISRGIAGALRR